MLSDRTKQLMRQAILENRPLKPSMEKLRELGPAHNVDHMLGAADNAEAIGICHEGITSLAMEIRANRQEAEQFVAALLGMA